MTSSLRMLLVCDDEARARRVSDCLATMPGAEQQRVGDLDALEAALTGSVFEVILLDLTLRAGGFEALEHARGFASETPVIALAADADPASSARALEGGARDVLTDRELELGLLPRVIGCAIACAAAEWRAKEADHRFVQFIDTIPMGVTIVDRAGAPYYANTRAHQILGPRLSLAAQGEEQLRNPLQAALAGESVHRRELELRREDRRTLVEVNGFPLLAADGATEYGVAVIQDITERKRVERAMRGMAKIDAMGALAASVAHDFNNLLSVIGTFAHLALEGMDESAPAHEDVREIVKATERSQSLVARLLNFAREESAVADSDVNAQIVSSKKMLSRLLGSEVELVLELDDRLAHAAVAEGEFEEVMINLAVNARDAMPRGGRLTVKTRSGTGPEPTVIVEVADTGIGMDEQTRARVFEPLFTTKAPGKGTGLGLASVLTLVTDAGGSIEVESAMGQGTRFLVSFPAIVPEAREITFEDLPAPAPEPTGPRLTTVLLVEDEEPFRRMLVRQLGRLGYAVLEASNGREGLEQYARDPHIDAVLTDVDMPGIDGPAMVLQLRALRPELPVVFMTGFDPPDVPDQVLQKPFPNEQLATAMGLATRTSTDPATPALGDAARRLRQASGS